MTASSNPSETYLKAVALSYLGRLALAWGEYEQAREPLDQAISLIRAVKPEGLILPLVARAQLARAERQHDVARGLVEEAVGVARAGGEGAARAFLAEGDLAIDAGDPAAAQIHYGEALERARVDRLADHAAQALDGLGRVARAQGATERARRLQGEALKLRHESRGAPGIAESLDVTARLGLKTDGVLNAALLFGAVGALRESSPDGKVPPEAALAPGRGSLAEEGMANSIAAGVTPGADEAPAEGCNGNAQGEGGMEDDWASLTEREQEVAALVAEGMSNQGIAERLFVSVATVKTHLVHIFSKWNLSRRSELAEEVWRRRRGSAPGETDSPDSPRNGA